MDAVVTAQEAVPRLTPRELGFIYNALSHALHGAELRESEIRVVLGLEYGDAVALMDTMLAAERVALEAGDHWRYIPPPNGEASPDAEGRVWTGLAWGPHGVGRGSEHREEVPFSAHSLVVGPGDLPPVRSRG